MTKDTIGTVVSALAALGVVGVIVWGISACSARQDQLAQACIKSGGTLISLPNGYHCIAKNVGGQS